MKYFDWNAVKNEVLKVERGISFEDIVNAIDEDRVLVVIDHPNQAKYPGQKVMIVNINDYAYVVPYVEDDEKYFLKTIYPSRAATELYIIIIKKRKT